MINKVVFGTTNKAKFGEYDRYFAASGISVLELQKLVPDVPDVLERGDTYASNALLKAQQYFHLTQLPTISEDSGIEVTALEGFPGINSHRWMSGTEHQRNQGLLQKLECCADRSAQFIDVICLYLGDTTRPRLFRGELSGEISTASHGDQGFGYDPIFIPRGYSRTIAELGYEVKNKISARSQAMQKLKDFLLSDEAQFTG